MTLSTELLPDLAYLRTLIVNVFFAGPRRGEGDWVLIDTGVPHADVIRQAAEERFGLGRAPAAIVLTHGHFDHIGSVKTLLETWDVPVYAHPDEMPYLTGDAQYPPPDPWAGGLIALTAPLFPRGPVDLRPNIRTLPADGSVPGMPGWRWIHSPGHTPGHIALFRDSDRALIAGDAFVTTRPESVYSVLMQKQELHGPPKHFTPDWTAARESVERLARLRPTLAATGHGLPAQGLEMLDELDMLVRSFDETAVPRQAKYVEVERVRPNLRGD